MQQMLTDTKLSVSYLGGRLPFILLTAKEFL